MEIDIPEEGASTLATIDPMEGSSTSTNDGLNTASAQTKTVKSDLNTPW